MRFCSLSAASASGFVVLSPFLYSCIAADACNSLLYLRVLKEVKGTLKAKTNWGKVVHRSILELGSGEERCAQEQRVQFKHDHATPTKSLVSASVLKMKAEMWCG